MLAVCLLLAGCATKKPVSLPPPGPPQIGSQMPPANAQIVEHRVVVKQKNANTVTLQLFTCHDQNRFQDNAHSGGLQENEEERRALCAGQKLHTARKRCALIVYSRCVLITNARISAWRERGRKPNPLEAALSAGSRPFSKPRPSATRPVSASGNQISSAEFVGLIPVREVIIV
jgi:hypothetical protein